MTTLHTWQHILIISNPQSHLTLSSLPQPYLQPLLSNKPRVQLLLSAWTRMWECLLGLRHHTRGHTPDMKWSKTILEKKDICARLQAYPSSRPWWPPSQARSFLFFAFWKSVKSSRFSVLKMYPAHLHDIFTWKREVPELLSSSRRSSGNKDSPSPRTCTYQICCMECLCTLSCVQRDWRSTSPHIEIWMLWAFAYIWKALLFVPSYTIKNKQTNKNLVP